MIPLLAQLSPGRITGPELLAITVAVTIAAIAVSALMMMKNRRIRNNVRRAQFAARVSAFEIIAFELGKVAGYEEQLGEAIGERRRISNENKRAMRAAYDEAKIDLASRYRDAPLGSPRPP